MKKKLRLLLILSAAIALEIIMVRAGNRVAWFSLDENNEPVIEVQCDNEREIIRPFLEETSGSWYFFCPRS